MHLFRQAIWRHICKFNLQKNHTNANNVTIHLFRQAIWGHIWKFTLEKNHTNATNVTLHLFKQAIWGHIWKLIQEKNRTNVTNATMHLLGQAIWGYIWKLTREKNCKTAINVTMHRNSHGSLRPASRSVRVASRSLSGLPLGPCAGCLEVLSRDALRSHVQVASRSQGTKFGTKIFNFRCFFGPSDRNGLYHTPLLSKIWGLGDRIFLC